jgi:RNA polymerase sigma-70 factor, ECF subfamily
MTTNEFHEDFLLFKNELKSFIFRLTTNREDTEDIVHDTYLKAIDSLHTFQGLSSLKTWVFAIALNLSRNHLRKQKRWLENAQDYGAMLHVSSQKHSEKLQAVFDATPEKNYQITEHIAYCFNCINKTLELTQQVCLLLKEVYEFKVSEIVAITNLSEGVVKHAIADARHHMIRIFDDRCAFVNKNGACHQCTALKGHLNPKHNAHMEALKIKMVREGINPDKEHLLNLRLELVKVVDPLDSPNSLLNTFMLENSENWVNEGIEKKVIEVRPK